MTLEQITDAINNLDFDSKLKIADRQILRFSAKKVYVWDAEGKNYTITDNDIAIAFLHKQLVNA